MRAEQLSISVRLRRVVTEAAHVSVTITQELIRPDGSGSGNLDAEKVMLAALELGRDKSTIWEQEGEVAVEFHPVQMPPKALRN